MNIQKIIIMIIIKNRLEILTLYFVVGCHVYLDNIIA